MKELANEDLISVERSQGEITLKIDDENIEELNNFASELRVNFSDELHKWDHRLSQAANEMIRIKQAVDDEDRIEEINSNLQRLKDSSEDIDLEALKTLSNVESFLGYGEIAREEMHAFHRKYKVLDKIEGF